MIKSPYDWVLALAYDLLNVNILNSDETKELALTLDGKKKKLKKEHLEKFKGLALTDKQIQRVFKRMRNNKPKTIEWIEHSFLFPELKMAYKKVVQNRYAQLNLAE